MRWQGRRQSGNVTDMRGSGGTIVGGGIGTLVLMALVYFLGGNPMSVINTQPAPSASTQAADPEGKEFVSVVLADTEEVWNNLFRQRGADYVEPELVLFSGQVNSACGSATAAVGPFYCPLDQKVYIDLSFYDQLKRQFGAPGDFAQAYVIAHEVGHHIQNQLGITDKLHQMRSRMSKEQYNKRSVQLELQADYLAGVWAHHARQMASLNAEDIQEAIGAASAIGDDRLQEQSQGHVVPETFTHGTSQQRVNAFTGGWKTGSFEQALERYDPVP